MQLVICKKSSHALAHLCEGVRGQPFGASANDVYIFIMPFAGRHVLRIVGLDSKQEDLRISIMALYAPK